MKYRVHPFREGMQLLLVALGTALLLLLAMPGRFEWWPLLFGALVPLLWFISRKNPRISFSAGLLAGFFYQTGMLYWIVIVLGRYGRLPPALSLPAMLLLAVYMALYTALFAAGLSWILAGSRQAGRKPYLALFAAPLLWVGLEWLRSFLFSGFPWMDLGYGLYSAPFLLQSADLGGHYLLSFLLVMGNALIFLLLDSLQRGSLSRPSRRESLAITAGVLVLAAAAGYSAVRTNQLEMTLSSAPTMRVAVVQGNISQDEKWTPYLKETTLEKYRKLTAQAVEEKEVTLVVWPETALPFFPGNDPLFEKVTGWAAEKQVWLLTGAPYFVLSSDLDRPFDKAVTYFNSALLIDPAGTVKGRYDKQHLVPFGEYVPLRKFLFFLEPLVESVGNFASGASGQPLSLGTVKAGVLICYESIFPELARKEVAGGADFLVNMTNDAWYGRSSAPYQSFAMSVLRTVETRRSLVRAANTGISGFVDPVGRILAQTPIFEPRSLSAGIPLLATKTLYSRGGYLFAPLCLLLAVLLLFRAFIKN